LNPYAEKTRGEKNPKISLLSNSEEARQGNGVIKHTYPLLKDSGLSFYGNIEGKELIGGIS
jgi:glycerol-3-phosphate acyltransferase PlsX